jgi:hypothetical protein
VQIDDPSLTSSVSGAVVSFKTNLIRAAILVGVGLGLCVAFADPIILVLSDLGVQFRASPFYIGYGIMPISVYSSLIWRVWKVSARKRNSYTALLYAPTRKQNAELFVSLITDLFFWIPCRYKQLYSTVTLANTLCLGIFLVSVYVQKPPWTWSTETLVVFVSCLIPGLVGSFRRNLPLWLCIPFIALYPMSFIFFKLLEETARWT